MTISYLPVRAPMIVFLDAQGVLREPRDLQSLDAVLQDYPDLSIVITSVQRAEPSLAELPAPFFRLVAERTVPQTFTRPIHATSGQRLMQLHHQAFFIFGEAPAQIVSGLIQFCNTKTHQFKFHRLKFTLVQGSLFNQQFGR